MMGVPDFSYQRVKWHPVSLVAGPSAVILFLDLSFLHVSKYISVLGQMNVTEVLRAAIC
jgi:hypothetical protein